MRKLLHHLLVYHMCHEGHTIKPGTPEHGTPRNDRTTSEHQGTTAEYRNTTEVRTWGKAWHFSLPSVFVRAQSYQSDEQVRGKTKILLDENYMNLKILLPFWLFLLWLHCWLADAAERTAEWQLWLAGNEVQSMDA